MKKTALLSVLLCMFLSSQGQIKFNVWDAEHLFKVKQAVDRGAAEYMPVLDRLIRDADKDLAKGNYSVTDKPMAPPSGDKHDYMSMGRYWWPNPATADGLPYIRKDGVSNPELEKYDRNRLGQMSNAVVRLALAYYFTANREYASRAAEIVRAWFLDPATRMNPNMNYAQFVPGHNDNLGRGEGVLDTYSLVPVVDAILILERDRYISKKDAAALRKWFEQYTQWMVESRSGQEEAQAKNNHGTAYDIQLAVFASYSGNNALAKATLQAFPDKRIFTQVEPDGSQPLELGRTTGFGYSVFNLTHYLDMCDVGRNMGIEIYSARSVDGRSIKAAIDYLTQFMGEGRAQFKYKQIKEWDQVQSRLAWQLHRASGYWSQANYDDLFEKHKGKSTDAVETLLFL